MFDLPALREVLQGLQDRRIRAVSVDTPKASPFAQSLLFGWIAVYMYEGDAPLAERRAAALALDRAHLELRVLGELVRRMYAAILPGVLTGSAAALDAIGAIADFIETRLIA